MGIEFAKTVVVTITDPLYTDTVIEKSGDEVTLKQDGDQLNLKLDTLGDLIEGLEHFYSEWTG